MRGLTCLSVYAGWRLHKLEIRKSTWGDAPCSDEAASMFLLFIILSYHSFVAIKMVSCTDFDKNMSLWLASESCLCWCWYHLSSIDLTVELCMLFFCSLLKACFSAFASVGASLEEPGRLTALSLECCPTLLFTPKYLNSVTSDRFQWEFSLIQFSLTPSKSQPNFP